jgi:hypothetical protein
MQIEQVIAGVNGDMEAQAVQLRMRSNSQNIVSRARLVAHDANGENPVVLIDIASDLANGHVGDRVLLASSKLTSYTDPPISPDYVLNRVIPASYLAAGSLTFENDEGTLLVWRLSWGGEGYAGPTGGALTNDDDGEFSPNYPVALPTSSLQALLFAGAPEAKGTNNAVDYVLTPAAAVFVNNSGESFTITELQCANGPRDDADGDFICADQDNCPELANESQFDDDGDGVGNACDNCPDDADKTEPGLCGCGRIDDDDDDADEAIDCIDNCPGLANADQADADGDGAGDACDECPQNSELVSEGPDGCEGAPDDDGSGSPNDSGSGDGAGPDDSPTGGAAPQGCGVGMLPLFLVSLLVLHERRGRRRG